MARKSNEILAREYASAIGIEVETEFGYGDDIVWLYGHKAHMCCDPMGQGHSDAFHLDDYGTLPQLWRAVRDGIAAYVPCAEDCHCRT